MKNPEPSNDQQATSTDQQEPAIKNHRRYQQPKNILSQNQLHIGPVFFHGLSKISHTLWVVQVVTP